ncbi:hypothetical protein [Flavobacterium sp.]
MSKSNEKHLYIVDDYPTMIVLDKAKYNEFKNILVEYHSTDRLFFLKKYSNILEKNIDRDWVIHNSKIIRRRYELTGLGTFEEEEEFYYDVFKNCLEQIKRIFLSGKLNDDEKKIEEFLEYVLFYKCTSIEPNSWYFKPEFNYSKLFYESYLPKSYKYLLEQNFIDDNKGDLEFSNLYAEKVINISEIIKNDSLDFFEYENKKEFYKFNSKFINSILYEIQFNSRKKIFKDDVESRIMEDDSNEFKNILLKAKDDDFFILIYL